MIRKKSIRKKSSRCDCNFVDDPIFNGFTKDFHADGTVHMTRRFSSKPLRYAKVLEILKKFETENKLKDKEIHNNSDDFTFITFNIVYASLYKGLNMKCGVTVRWSRHN